MTKIRVAQIGQTRINRPFFEVNTEQGRFVFAVNEFDQVQFKNRAWLRSIGFSTQQREVYQDQVTPVLTQQLNLNSMGITDRSKFTTTLTNLGTGLAFSP